MTRRNNSIIDLIATARFYADKIECRADLMFLVVHHAFINFGFKVVTTVRNQSSSMIPAYSWPAEEDGNYRYYVVKYRFRRRHYQDTENRIHLQRQTQIQRSTFVQRPPIYFSHRISEVTNSREYLLRRNAIKPIDRVIRKLTEEGAVLFNPEWEMIIASIQAGLFDELVRVMQ
ncbi:hypothetical protein ACOME3_005299 [Neoechinorhynchus agilis]